LQELAKIPEKAPPMVALAFVEGINTDISLIEGLEG
jgi:hypothetical protein